MRFVACSSYRSKEDTLRDYAYQTVSLALPLRVSDTAEITAS